MNNINKQNRNANTLSIKLKKRIALQLNKKGFSKDEITEIMFAPYEGNEWKYCGDGKELIRTLEEGYWANKINNNRIITLDNDFGCSYLICFKID